MILVTGGTGLLGGHLLLYLAENQQIIRAIYRDISALEKVRRFFLLQTSKGQQLFEKIEWVRADITQIPELELAFEGITQVFHAAGFVSFNPQDAEILYKINIEGTANVVNLCIDFKIKKLCYVSSVAALGKEGAKGIDENSHWNPDDNNHDYAISKHGGEMEVWRASQEGVDVVVVNPAVILGSGFWEAPSSLIFNKINEGLTFYTTGGTGVVAADDVARAMIQLMQSDIKNERFVLNQSNITYKQLLTSIAEKLGKKPPKRKISCTILAILAILDGFFSFLRIKKRKLTLNNAQSLSTISAYNGEKITQILDFSYTPLDRTLQKITDDFKSEFGK